MIRILSSSCIFLAACFVANAITKGALPDTSVIDRYVADFNAHDRETYRQYVPNEEAARFLKDNIPLFECPDK